MYCYPRLGVHGRFGNQLFQIASTIGLAVKDQVDYGFPLWRYEPYLLFPLPRINKQKRIVPLQGYLQDYRNFYHCEKLIKSSFQFRYMKVKELYDSVFIHFRAYSDERVEKHHPEMDRTYYEKAMMEFPKDTDFIVFSDNIGKAKKIIPSKENVLFCGNMGTLYDFYQMTSCKGAIISNSTFSWWAAWLGKEKQVIMPKHWFSETGKWANIDIASLIYPKWKVI